MRVLQLVDSIEQVRIDERIRYATTTRANAALAAAQNRIPLAHAWGDGDVASADGLRFVVPGVGSGYV